MPFGHDLFRWRYLARSIGTEGLRTCSCCAVGLADFFQKKKNDAAAVMRSRCALEKLCARSEKRLGKRELPDTVDRMKIVTDRNIV